VTAVYSENPELVLETTEYTWEAMVDILMHIEAMDFDKYPDWMKSNFYENLLDEDVDIIMRCDGEKWAVRFPVVECLLEIRSHPMFHIGRGAELHVEEAPLDAAVEENMNELLNILTDMVKVGRRAPLHMQTLCRYVCPCVYRFSGGTALTWPY